MNVPGPARSRARRASALLLCGLIASAAVGTQARADVAQRDLKRLREEGTRGSRGGIITEKPETVPSLRSTGPTLAPDFGW